MPKSRLTKEPKTDPVAAIVDELGALETELAPFAAKIARIETLRKALRACYADAPADQEFTAEGAEFAYLVGEKALERHITSMAAVYKAVGRAQFLARCGFALKHIDELGLGHLVEKARTGSRSLKLTEKAKAKAA